MRKSGSHRRETMKMLRPDLPCDPFLQPRYHQKPSFRAGGWGVIANPSGGQEPGGSLEHNLEHSCFHDRSSIRPCGHFRGLTAHLQQEPRLCNETSSINASAMNRPRYQRSRLGQEGTSMVRKLEHPYVCTVSQTTHAGNATTT